MLTERTVDYIMNLWEEAGEPWKTPDGVNTSKGIIRDAVAKASPEWADSKISYLKSRKAAQKVKAEMESPSASPAQKSYGKSLDKKLNGSITRDWDAASMAEAWRWIKDLKDAAEKVAA